MSSEIPPNPYFSGIDFNSSFFSKLTDYLTEAIANSKYLKLIGGILSGNLGIKRTPAVELDVNGKVFINNNINATPSNGVYGGDGTRLILSPGTISTPPYSLGIAGSTLWYGVPDGATHRFYTGTDERLRIKSDGNVGIGTNDPQTKLDVRGKINTESAATGAPENGTYGGNGARLILYPGTASAVAYSLGITGGTMWYAVPAGATFHNFYNGTTNIATFLNTSFEILALKSPSNTNYQLLFAPPSATTGAGIQTILQGSGYSQDLTLQQQGGNVGIGTTNPDNILQVGNGGRLRISNGTSDYTLIGSKETDDANNTRIVISGSSRTGYNGNIEYYATSTGRHKFYLNNSTTLVDWDETDCTFYNSITTIGANYFTDGEYIPHSPKTNTSGVLKNGYFIYMGYFYNSFINIALSHNDSTYSYWHGHIGTNNSTAPMYITATAQNNATIESFQEQTTNIYWIYFRPTSSYNASVQLRVKFYG